MGYRILSLRSLPVIPGIDLYVFILGQHSWAGGYSQIIENNFSELARKLGERGAVVAGHDGVRLAKELSTLLSGVALKNKTVHDFVSKGESLGLSILLLGAHPSELTENSLFLLVPVAQIVERFGSLDEFFTKLCDFAENRDISFLNKFEDQGAVKGGISQFLELRPNMFGVGLNVNAIIDRWLGR